jgi:hypothetical protein
MPLLNGYRLSCPYCLEQIEITVDATAGSQEYTEDCEVCCNPIVFRIDIRDGGKTSITADRENA